MQFGERTWKEIQGLTDRVVLLREGEVVQVDRPEDIYARPVDAWAARLTGPASFVSASAVPPSAVPEEALAEAGPRSGEGADHAASFMVRPEFLIDAVGLLDHMVVGENSLKLQAKKFIHVVSILAG